MTGAVIDMDGLQERYRRNSRIAKRDRSTEEKALHAICRCECGADLKC